MLLFCFLLCRWNKDSSSGSVEKSNLLNQEREQEMQTFLHKNKPKENGQIGEYTVIPLNDIPEKYFSNWDAEKLDNGLIRQTQGCDWSYWTIMQKETLLLSVLVESQISMSCLKENFDLVSFLLRYKKNLLPKTILFYSLPPIVQLYLFPLHVFNDLQMRKFSQTILHRILI